LELLAGCRVSFSGVTRLQETANVARLLQLGTHK
jgi:hypothetical protein